MALVKLTGILKLELDPEALEHVRRLQAALPPGAKPLAEHDIHVTLVHQRIMKKIAFMLTDGPWETGPTIQLADKIHQIDRQDRRSWIALVKNQREVREFVDGFLSPFDASVDREPGRVFHVSLANLDGSPFASVGDVRWDDVGGLDALLG